MQATITTILQKANRFKFFEARVISDILIYMAVHLVGLENLRKLYENVIFDSSTLYSYTGSKLKAKT